MEDLTLNDMEETRQSIFKVQYLEMQGTGWLCSPDGYILTAGHIITNEQESIIRQKDDVAIDICLSGKTYKGEVIYCRYNVECHIDFALVKIDIDGEPFLPMNITFDIGDINSGHKVHIEGYGERNEASSTSGVGEVQAPYGEINKQLLKINCQDAAQAGFSGAPVFSFDFKRVIGIQVKASLHEQGATRDNVLAMPINRILSILEEEVPSISDSLKQQKSEAFLNKKTQYEMIKKGIVNILDNESRCVGTGFFVKGIYDGLILTSYQALELIEPVATLSHVSFKLNSSEQTYKGRIGFFCKDYDLVVLTTNEVKPGFAFTLSEDVQKNTSFTTVGFADGKNSVKTLSCENFSNDDNHIIINNAHSIPFEYNGAPIISQNENVVGMFSCVHDAISEGQHKPWIIKSKPILEVCKIHNILLSSKATGFSLPFGFVDSIFHIANRPNIYKEFTDCFKDETRIEKKLEPKFLFFGDDVAESHIHLLESPGYSLFEVSKNILESNISNVVRIAKKSGKDIRLISLGIGNGKKDAVVLDKILEKTNGIVEYFVFDISDYMIRKGLTFLRHTLRYFDRLSIKVFDMDFLKINEVLNNGNMVDKQNILLLLGNTIGNFDDESVLLGNIHKAMMKDDLILIDNQILKTNKLSESEKDALLNIYKSDADDNLAREILEQAGLNQSVDGEIETKLVEDPSCRASIMVEKKFKIYNNKENLVYNHSVKYRAGHSIIVYHSKKYTEHELIAIIEMSGLKKIKSYIGNNKRISCATILATKDN